MTNARWGWLGGAMLLVACSGAGNDASVGPPTEVVVRTDAASPADCPYGGSVVSSGLDRNGDHVLQDDEIVTRAVVCSPAPVLPPAPVVVRLVAEPRGAHCSAGGTAVQSGPDRNRNGRLDDDEVVHIDYVCGQALLTRLVAEPTGARCIAGGVAFVAGRDRDGDGVLGDDEIETTELECGDVLSRNVTIQSAADVAALANIKVITGDLVASGTRNLADLSLPALEHVGGSLEVFANVDLRRVAFPQLHDVDGGFQLRFDPLTALDCPQLRRVGSFDLGEIGLADLRGLPALTEVDRDLRLFDSSLLAADLSGVAVAGNITITDNLRLARMTLRLAGRVGSVLVTSNPGLRTADLSVAPAAGSPGALASVEVSGNDSLVRLALSAATVQAFTVGGNPQLSDIALDVAKFDSAVWLFGAGTPFDVTLSSSSADGSIEVGGDLLVSGPLRTMRSLGQVTVDGELELDKTLLQGFDPGNPWFVHSLVLSRNSRLTELSPITLGGSLFVTSNALLLSVSSLTLRDGTELDTIVITDNPALASAPSLAGVTRVRGAVDVERNPRLTSLFGPALFRVEGPMRIDENARLTSLVYPRLEHIEADLEVFENDSLQTLEMPALTEVAAELFIISNAQLHHLALDSLARSDLFLVQNNRRLPSCEVRAVFSHVPGPGKVQSGNDDTATCTP